MFIVVASSKRYGVKFASLGKDRAAAIQPCGERQDESLNWWLVEDAPPAPAVYPA
jgi:hypothetical protein